VEDTAHHQTKNVLQFQTLVLEIGLMEWLELNKQCATYHQMVSMDTLQRQRAQLKEHLLQVHALKVLPQQQ
jgi:hypothetical protein